MNGSGVPGFNGGSYIAGSEGSYIAGAEGFTSAGFAASQGSMGFISSGINSTSTGSGVGNNPGFVAGGYTGPIHGGTSGYQQSNINWGISNENHQGSYGGGSLASGGNIFPAGVYPSQANNSIPGYASAFENNANSSPLQPSGHGFCLAYDSSPGFSQ